jgi:hypothetical protein
MPVVHIPSTKNNDTKKSANIINNFLKNGKHAFVLIYRDGCPPCMATHPEWLKMQTKFENDDNIGVFDVEESMLSYIDHEGVKKNIAGVPTMRHVHGAKTEDYEDCKDITPNRTYDSFLMWVDKAGSMRGGGRRATRKRITRRRTGGRKWSLKYKRSINCRRPRGFSQRQYCKRRNSRR